jgi:hypothetical protein
MTPRRRGATKASYKRSFSLALASLPEDLRPAEATPPGRVPSQASTNFVQNQSRGRWAEALVRDLLTEQGHCIVPYGNDVDLIAGEPGFKEYFTGYLTSLERVGKKCDLLLMPPGSPKGKVAEKDVSRAVAALEVRSSAQTVGLYYAALEGASEGRPHRGFLSFTIKVGDLAAVARWVENYGVPHCYVQVFEDRMYVIDTLAALRLLADPEGRGKSFTVERNSRSQFKTTVHIDIAQGTHLADITDDGELVGRSRVLPSGRIIDYCERRGGQAALTEAGTALFPAPQA